MEAQVRGARAKQKNQVKGLKQAERKPPSPETAKRSFVSTANKRAIARFAKGPSDTGGFSYPRRRVLINVDVKPILENESACSIVAVSVEKESEEVIVEQVVVENLCAVLPETISESSEVEEKQVSDEESTALPVIAAGEPDVKSLVDEDVRLVDMSQKDECSQEKVDECGSQTENVSKKIEVEEIPDDTVGPGDSRSSESESSEDSETETVEPMPVAKVMKSAPKPAPPAVRKVVSPVPQYRKVASAPVPVRSSWSRFLPLVIEIKATIPYPMHLLGFFLLLVTGLLLRLLYQFGAELGGEMDLQAQLLRVAKLALLFSVVAMCVNFVEDNKELHQKDPVLPVQPKLRPSKMSKNKKKMMLKV